MCHFSKLAGYHDRRMFFELARNSKWKTGDHRGKKKRLAVCALPCRSIGLSHENALAPHSDWVLFWASLINWAGLHDIIFGASGIVVLVFLICVAVFLFSFFLPSRYGNGGMGCFRRICKKKNKYPAICTNYDDLQESGNTHPPNLEGGWSLGAAGHDFQGNFWGGEAGGGEHTTGARQILE